jgi:hypothetical protein
MLFVSMLFSLLLKELLVQYHFPFIAASPPGGIETELKLKKRRKNNPPPGLPPIV